MKENKYSLLLLILFISMGCQPKQEVSELPERRVVSLVPSVTDFGRLIIPELLVGVSTNCDTALLNQPTRIAVFPKINYEALLKLKPTEVLALKDFTSSEQINKLQRAGLKVVVLSKETVQDVIQTPLKIDSVRGKELNEQLKVQYRELLKHQLTSSKSYLILISELPMQVFGQGNYITELFDDLGFVNKANGFKGYPELQKEFFVKNLPDVLISSDTLATQKNLQTAFGKVLKKDVLSRINYVQLHQNRLYKPGPNFLKNGEELLRQIGR